jgi:hypothetical protein
MPNYSESESQDAKRIVELLLANEREAYDLEDTVVVSDVEQDAADFANDLQILEDFGLDCPAVRLGNDKQVPLALWFIGGGSSSQWPVMRGPQARWFPNPFGYEFWYQWVRAAFENREQSNAFETMSRKEARATFVEGATDFLATRIAAVHELDRPQSREWFGNSFLNILQRAGGPRVSTPGCHFTVSTNSNGLRVFWSGAYRVSPNYFSHPTTPALGVLQSGTYLFGVDGGAYGNQIQWDLNAVVTLPGNPHAHLNY